MGLIIISTDWGSLAPLVSGDRQTLYDAHFLENSEAQVRRSLSATLTAPRPLDRVTNWQLVVYVVAQVAAGGWASGAAKVSTTVRSIQYQPSFVG